MDLASSREKLARAAEHQSALREAIDVWAKSDVFHVIGTADAATGWFTVTYHQRTTPPLRLGTMFGDFVNNLAGALDHLIYQLVIECGNTPYENNYFPIAEVQGKWEANRLSKLKGVDRDLVALIGQLQPFHDGQDARMHPLALLHKATTSTSTRSCRRPRFAV